MPTAHPIATSRISDAPGGGAAPGRAPGGAVHASRAIACLEVGRAPCDNVPLAPGEGRLAFASVDGASALVGCAARSPLQIVVPRPRGVASWAVLVSHGGGLVAGDRVRLDVTVGEGASALVTTQAETKAYRAQAPGGDALQELTVRLGAGATLALLPDPVSCFAGARYAQRQRFALAAGASLLLCDAVVAGRVARGERWAFASYRSENRVLLEGALLAHDALALADRPGRPLAARLADFDALALVLAAGPAFAPGAAALAARIAEASADPSAPVLASASPLPRGPGFAFRLAARSAAALDAWLRAALSFAAGPLGGDPFTRRW